MFEVIVTGIILYLLYKLVFDFVVPVSRTASQFKNQVNEMRRQQEEQMRRQQQNTTSAQNKTSDKKNTTTTDGEYIDFEEVK
jgi:Sec-independent protein translocase protein TatA